MRSTQFDPLPSAPIIVHNWPFHMRPTAALLQPFWGLEILVPGVMYGYFCQLHSFLGLAACRESSDCLSQQIKDAAGYTWG